MSRAKKDFQLGSSALESLPHELATNKQGTYHTYSLTDVKRKCLETWVVVAGPRACLHLSLVLLKCFNFQTLAPLRPHHRSGEAVRMQPALFAAELLARCRA